MRRGDVDSGTGRSAARDEGSRGLLEEAAGGRPTHLGRVLPPDSVDTLSDGMGPGRGRPRHLLGWPEVERQLAQRHFSHPARGRSRDRTPRGRDGPEVGRQLGRVLGGAAGAGRRAGRHGIRRPCDPRGRRGDAGRAGGEPGSAPAGPPGHAGVRAGRQGTNRDRSGRTRRKADRVGGEPPRPPSHIGARRTEPLHLRRHAAVLIPVLHRGTPRRTG